MSFDSLNARKTENAAMPDLIVSEFVAGIKNRLDKESPLITSTNLAAFSAGDILTGSFDLSQPDRGLLKAVFDRAANAKDILASGHALKHSEVGLALQTLAKGAGTGTIKIRPFTVTNNDREERRFEFIQDDSYEMKFPEAVFEAGLLLDRPEPDQVRGLRDVARSCGYDVALLTGAYLNLDPAVIFEKVFDRQALAQADHGGLLLPIRQRVRHPPQNHFSDEKIYLRLRSVINQEENPHNLQLNTDAAAYAEATNILAAWGSHPANLIDVNVRLNGQAVAIMPSLMDRAYAVADPDFREPKLTETVKTYQNRVATNVITGYIKWSFKSMKVITDSVPHRDPDHESRVAFVPDLGE